MLMNHTWLEPLFIMLEMNIILEKKKQPIMLSSLISNILFLRNLAVQGGFPGHGVPRRGRWVLWFGWLLGSPGLICGREKSKGMNEEIRKEKCHLSCNKWEVQLCWPYIWQTHLPIYLLHTQTCTYISSVHKTEYTGWRGVRFSFIQRGTKPFLNKSLP